MKRQIIALLIIIACLVAAMPVCAESPVWRAHLSCGLCGGRHPLEVEMSWGRFSLVRFGENYTVPSPSPEISAGPIRVNQSALEVAYRRDISKALTCEAGARIVTDRHIGAAQAWDKTKGEWALIPVTLKDGSLIRPFGAIEIASEFGRFEVRGRVGISQDGADFKGGLECRVAGDIRVAAGYRYWPMEGWYQGPFVGVSIAR